MDFKKNSPIKQMLGTQGLMYPQNQMLPNNVIQNQQTPISPQAFSNQNTIANMYGQANPGTFTRTVGSPLMQMIDPLTGQSIDPTMSQDTTTPQAVTKGSAMAPTPPPAGIQTPITPNYDLNY